MDENVKKVLDTFKLKFPKKEVLSIVDYDEEGIYVVFAIPKNQIQNRNKWMDGLHAVSKENPRIVKSFQPLDHHPEIYFGLGPERTIYKK